MGDGENCTGLLTPTFVPWECRICIRCACKHKCHTLLPECHTPEWFGLSVALAPNSCLQMCCKYCSYFGGSQGEVASALCSQLGLPRPGRYVHSSVFGPGSGPVLLSDEIGSCRTPYHIDNCQRPPWSGASCGHDADLGLLCNASLGEAQFCAWRRSVSASCLDVRCTPSAGCATSSVALYATLLVGLPGLTMLNGSCVFLCRGDAVGWRSAGALWPPGGEAQWRMGRGEKGDVFFYTLSGLGLGAEWARKHVCRPDASCKLARLVPSAASPPPPALAGVQHGLDELRPQDSNVLPRVYVYLPQREHGLSPPGPAAAGPRPAPRPVWPRPQQDLAEWRQLPRHRGAAGRLRMGRVGQCPLGSGVFLSGWALV